MSKTLDYVYTVSGEVINVDEDRYSSTDVYGSSHGDSYSVNSQISHHRAIKFWLKDEKGKESVYEFHDVRMDLKIGDQITLVIDKKTNIIVRVINKNLGQFFTTSNIQRNAMPGWYNYISNNVFGFKNMGIVLLVMLIPLVNILGGLAYIFMAIRALKDKFMLRQMPWLLAMLVSLPIMYSGVIVSMLGQESKDFIQESKDFITDIGVKSKVFIVAVPQAISDKNKWENKYSDAEKADLIKHQQARVKEGIRYIKQANKDKYPDYKIGIAEGQLAQAKLVLSNFQGDYLNSIANEYKNKLGKVRTKAEGNYMYGVNSSRSSNDKAQDELLYSIKKFIGSGVLLWFSFLMFYKPLYRFSRQQIATDETMIDEYCRTV